MPLSALPATAQAGGSLVGTFAITAGSCASGVSGSYFRMILPTGDADGPYVSNGDSPCADQTYSPLLPGTDGGLVSGSTQPAPSPAFDGAGNGLAARITRPTPFFGVTFAASTESVDPQSGRTTPPPSIAADGAGNLSGDLSSFGASWNEQHFNQGAPKPDGSFPGNSSKLTGTYDAGSGAFSMTWRSQIVGGPFDNFTGVWHLEGTFRAAGSGAPTATTAPSSPGAGAPAGQGGTAATVPESGGATATTAPDAGSPAAGDEQQTAAPGGSVDLAAETVSTDVTTREDGWRPATWLVLLLATLGLAGAVTLVYLSRTEPERAS